MKKYLGVVASFGLMFAGFQPAFASNESFELLESILSSSGAQLSADLAAQHHAHQYWKCEGTAINYHGQIRYVTYGGYANDYNHAVRSAYVSCEKQFKSCYQNFTCRAI